MVNVIVRADEACAPDSYALWDSVWSPADGFADWQLSDGTEPQNKGGLRAKAALATAVTLALFTDKRIDPSHALFYLADGDPRGWWGDGIDVRADLGEADLGSYLWLLERAPMTIRGQSVSFWAEQFAAEALLTLQTQGVVSRIEVAATAVPLKSRLELLVRLYGNSGAIAYDQKFDLVWSQVR